MVDAKRSEVGKKAYNDFIQSLEEIQQSSPLQGEFIGEALPKDLKDLPEGLTAKQLADKAAW